jgi:TolB-like protein
VEYAITGGTAENGTDYTLKNGTLVFEPGELSKSIDIGTVDDNLHEDNETIEVTLSNPVNAVLGKQTVHAYTIIDNDPEPTATFTAQGQEVRENNGSAVVTLQLSAVHGKDVTVPFIVSGTAQEAADYTITPGPLVIKTGETSGTITIKPIDDHLYEDNESIIVTLGTPVNATIGAHPVNITTIRDNDPPPAVAFALKDSSGDEGKTPAKIEVSLGEAGGKRASVEYAITGGTAENGTDYTLKNGTLVFEPGELSKSIDIGTIDDNLHEDNETIEVTLSNPVNAVLGKQTVHAYTIIDNDPEPTVTFSAPGQEIREDSGKVTVSVNLSAVSGKDVTVPFTLSGTAVAGKNYWVMTPNPLTIRAGETTGVITVALMDDKQYEDTKTIVVTLGKPVNATPGARMSHTVTVLDADAPPRIAIMPFTNESSRKYAGEIMALHFLRELIKGRHFTVVEPGLIIEKLLDYRIIMYEGISLSDANLIAGELKADLTLTGRVLDYREQASGSGKPKVGFSLLLINRRNQQVVWSSSSRNEGDDAVSLFDWGRINTVHALAADMASAIGKMIEQR